MVANCPQCKRPVVVVDPGSMQCPHCGRVFQPGEPGTLLPANTQKHPRSLRPDLEPDDGNDLLAGTVLIPKEPWYYGFFQLSVTIGTFLGLLAVVFLVGIYVLDFLRWYRSPRISNVLLSIGGFLLGIFVVLFWRACMSLLLDVARNIRIMRYNSQR